MPTYDYKCDKCEHQFEIYQSMKDEKLTACPNCGTNSLRRLIGSGSGLIFKGSGFYLTDYKNKPAENKVNASTGSESKNAETTAISGEAGKTEPKPAASSENSGSPGENKSSGVKPDNKPVKKQESKSSKESEDK
ncbi:MAG: zinc ribbon domain-containing protein [Bacteroidota bacterium]|nr:zinc ribbon domain-containing protein [Bacteroidota bacterium]